MSVSSGPRVSYPQKRRVPDQKRRVPGQKQPKKLKNNQNQPKSTKNILSHQVNLTQVTKGSNVVCSLDISSTLVSYMYRCNPVSSNVRNFAKRGEAREMQGTFSRKLEKSRENKGNQGNIREITRKLYFRIYSTSYPHARRLKTRPKRTQCGSSVLHTTPASNGLHDGNFTSKFY